MSDYYKGKIKVIAGSDLMCFPADPRTYEPLDCSSYDPWAISDPDQSPVKTIGYAEWWEELQKRRAIRAGGEGKA